MAIPSNLESIETNLPQSHLQKVVQALEAKNVYEVPGSYSIYAEAGQWEVDFEEARYEVREFVEEVASVRLISADASLVQPLVDTLEAELSTAVAVRDFDVAKEINHKIISLKAVISGKHQLSP